MNLNMQPLRQGYLTDVRGLAVGHYSDFEAFTGCTVVLCPPGTVAGVDVRGAAPGTRETDLLDPINTVPHVNAVVLTGGSAFGLEAASGVMSWLSKRGRGVQIEEFCIPIVPAAVIFDLLIGDGHKRPQFQDGYAACEAAQTSQDEGSDDSSVSLSPLQGNVGAGVGATVGKLLGPELSMKGGLGSASLRVGDLTVAAMVVCNAMGDVVDPQTGQIVAGARRSAQSLELLDLQAQQLKGQPGRGVFTQPGLNTTLGVVASNAKLTKVQAKRMAQIAHDGLARTIRPVHTPLDGDTIFSLATGEVDTPVDMMLMSTLVAEVTGWAVLNAVRAAQGVKVGERFWPSVNDL
jgi:L-aminopeptidase/D-esterase-like protein